MEDIIHNLTIIGNSNISKFVCDSANSKIIYKNENNSNIASESETNTPVTDPPVTDPPVTDPPVTDPPVTDPPVTDPPASLVTLDISSITQTINDSPYIVNRLYLLPHSDLSGSAVLTPLLETDVSGTIYDYSGALASDTISNPVLFSGYPNLEFDSYIAIGTDQAATTVDGTIANNGGWNNLTGNTGSGLPVGSGNKFAWFRSNYNFTTDPVLIAQITISTSATGTMAFLYGKDSSSQFTNTLTITSGQIIID
jgi:hypothetical protein